MGATDDEGVIDGGDVGYMLGETDDDGTKDGSDVGIVLGRDDRARLGATDIVGVCVGIACIQSWILKEYTLFSSDVAIKVLPESW